MIVFRVDSSVRIGNGHVARCLTLANALRERRLRSVFVCRMQPGEPSALIEANGFEVLRLAPTDEGMNSLGISEPCESLWSDARQSADATQTLTAITSLDEDVSWVVADHYGLGAKWEQTVTVCCSRMLVIDDLANRRHACDMLLDQNYYAGLEGRYQGLVPRDCRLFLGPTQALLRPEFRAATAKMRHRDGTVRRILVAFGSTDHGGETRKALLALRTLDLARVSIDVVVGASNPHRREVRALCDSIRGCNYHEQIDYMAKLMLDADVALGAGGATTWERCALGLPTLTIITAPNQAQTTVDTAATGAIVLLGRSEAVDRDDIAAAVTAAVGDPARNRDVGLRALSLVPAVDGAARLAQSLSSFMKTEISDNQ